MRGLPGDGPAEQRAAVEPGFDGERATESHRSLLHVAKPVASQPMRRAEDPDAVKEFFTHSEFGVSARFKKLIDTLAGEENSLLLNRNNALQDKIDDNNDRIETLTGRLDRERERLLLEFYRLEESIARD